MPFTLEFCGFRSVQKDPDPLSLCQVLSRTRFVGVGCSIFTWGNES